MGQNRTSFVVRDLRHMEKFQVDDEYLTGGYSRILGVYCTAVYLSLCRRVNTHQECFPSIQTIADDHGISVASVKRAIKKLSLHNIIKYDKERRESGVFLNNIYYLLDKSQWRKEPINDQSSYSHHGSVGAMDQSSVGATKDKATYKDKDKATYNGKYIGRVKDFFDKLDESWLSTLSEAYSTVNLNDEFLKMRAWLVSNPPKKNFKRFATNWLANINNRRGVQNGQHRLCNAENRVSKYASLSVTTL